MTRHIQEDNDVDNIEIAYHYTMEIEITHFLR